MEVWSSTLLASWNCIQVEWNTAQSPGGISEAGLMKLGWSAWVEAYRAFKQQGPPLEFNRMREDYCKVPACFKMG